MQLKPIGDKLLVRNLTDVEAGETSKGGIILINNEHKERQVVVVAIGPDVKNNQIQVGDRILLTQLTLKDEFSRTDSETLSVIKEADIIGVIEP